jgi:PA-IL-like protein
VDGRRKRCTTPFPRNLPAEPGRLSHADAERIARPLITRISARVQNISGSDPRKAAKLGKSAVGSALEYKEGAEDRNPSKKEEVSMFRRLMLIATFAASAGTYALAQSIPATIVLTDGSRHSGTMGFYGEKKENLIGGYIGLDTPNGRERYKVEQVAAIDFSSGGHPPANEVSQLPSDNNSNVIVLKDGYAQKGKLAGLVAGNVQWQNEAGVMQPYAISDVQRLYLNPGSARTALNNPSAGAVATTGSSPAAGSVQVPANQACTDSGVSVKKGDRVSFQATGQVSFAQGQTASPDGSGDVKNPNYPVPVAGAGALVGRVGNSAAFPIGSNTSPITMPADGRLRLCINDDMLNDNTGSFSVSVRKQ